MKKTEQERKKTLYNEAVRRAVKNFHEIRKNTSESEKIKIVFSRLNEK
jgi:hypothetical protein